MGEPRTLQQLHEDRAVIQARVGDIDQNVRAARDQLNECLALRDVANQELYDINRAINQGYEAIGRQLCDKCGQMRKGASMCLIGERHEWRGS